jgi:hypothetical protein
MTTDDLLVAQVKKIDLGITEDEYRSATDNIKDPMKKIIEKYTTIGGKISDQWQDFGKKFAAHEFLSLEKQKAVYDAIADKAFELQKKYNLKRSYTDILITESEPLLYSLGFTAAGFMLSDKYIGRIASKFVGFMIPDKYDGTIRNLAIVSGVVLSINYAYTCKQRANEKFLVTKEILEPNLLPIFEHMKKTYLINLENQDVQIKQKFEKQWERRERSTLGSIGHTVNNLFRAKEFNATVDKKAGTKNN